MNTHPELLWRQEKTGPGHAFQPERLEKELSTEEWTANAECLEDGAAARLSSWSLVLGKLDDAERIILTSMRELAG